MCLVSLWLMFVTVFSDIYSNASGAAILLAIVLVALGVLSYRRQEAAIAALPVVFMVGVLLSTVGFLSQASPRALLPSQMLFAVCLGAGLGAWRTASARARGWAVALLGLGLLVTLQGLLHSPFPLSQSYFGLPLALGACTAAAAALTRPAPRKVLAAFLVAALLVAPILVWAILTYGRSAVEIGTFNINFISVPIGCGLVAAVMLLIERRSPWLLTAAVLLLAVVVLGNSKTVLLALLVSGVTTVWIHRTGMTLRTRLLALGLVFAAVVGAYVAPALFLSRAVDGTPIVQGTRTVGDAGMSVQLRLDLARESWPNVMVDPLLGVGPLGNVIYYRTEPTGQTTWSRSPLAGATGTYAPHTGLISMPASMGIPLALLVFGTWAYGMLARRDPRVRQRLLPLAVFIATTALTIDWERSHMAAVLWLPLGVLLAAEDA